MGEELLEVAKKANNQACVDLIVEIMEEVDNQTNFEDVEFNYASYETMENKYRMTGHESDIKGVWLDPTDDNGVYTCSYKYSCHWDCTSQQRTNTLQKPGSSTWIYAIVVTEDGKTVFTGTGDQVARMYEVDTMTVVK